MAYYGEDIIERVREASDIVEIISEFLPLKRKGRNYWARCPFHQEKAPSFSVSPDKQIYHCFGCQKGGNVFSFIMEHEKLPFPEALKYLAKRADIALPSVSFRQESKELERIYFANEVAAEFFFENLKDSAKTLDYLRQRRLNDETIERFKLGYALESWDALLKHAKSKSLTEEDLEKAGLLVRSDKDTLYDRFRDRLTFTIFSSVLKPIAFGARTFKDEEAAKYINSPETPLYHKAKVLYGLSHSRTDIRRQEEAVVVEGYFDFLTLFQAGLRNVVASSGTAFTREQAQLLGRSAAGVILMFDADSAGQQAAVRSVDYLFGAGLDVRVAVLPHGEDPDSIVRQRGAEAIRELLGEAQSFVQFSLATLPDRFENLSLAAKDKAIKRLTELAGKLDDPVKRELFVQEISKWYRIDVDVVKLAVKPSRDKPQPRSETTSASRLDDDLLALLLAAPELIGLAAASVSPSDFVDEVAADIYRLMLMMPEESHLAEPAHLIDKLEAAQHKEKVAALASQTPAGNQPQLILEDYLIAYRRRHNKRRLAELKQGLADAEREEDQQKIDYYLGEISRLRNR